MSYAANFVLLILLGLLANTFFNFEETVQTQHVVTTKRIRAHQCRIDKLAGFLDKSQYEECLNGAVKNE